MRANIPDELMNAIDDRIYLDLEIHVLNRKFVEADKQGENGYAAYLNDIIKKVTNKRKRVNTYLKENGVTIYDVVEIDEYFVEYPYSQKINGGYKEGVQRYWKSAIKLNLSKRINNYFGGG